MNDGATTGRGFLAGTHDEILNQEVIGGRTEVWIDEWFLRHELRY
jgi:hypothetical protein